MSETSLLSADTAAACTLDAASVPEAGIISRTLLTTPGLRVSLMHFAAGQELTPHTNRRRALIQVLEGQCEFQFADTWQRLDRGAFLHLPPDHPHAVRASDGPFSMLLTLIADSSPSSS